MESGDVAVGDVHDVSISTFTGVTGGIMVQGQDCTADIYDGQGRLIIKKAVTNGSFVSLSAGFYIVRNGKDNAKVIVK